MEMMQPDPDSMNMENVIYWRPNKVMLTLFPPLTQAAVVTDVHGAVAQRVGTLNAQVLTQSKFKLALQMPVPTSGMPSMPGMPGMPSMPGMPVPTTGSGTAVNGIQLPGIYPYTSFRISKNTPTSDIAVFCDIVAANASDDDGEDHTLQVVKQINENGARSNCHASPNWLWSNVSDVVHGCPVSPAFPVTDAVRAGQWKTSLPTLSGSLGAAKGAGVQVLVLDAFPSPQQITEAAQVAGTNNTLLQRMAQGMVSAAPFQATAPAIGLNYTYAVPDPADTASTGKDIYGRLSGFPMPDHGVFIAGLIRDLAPEATIECIRVMNDFGVGDIQTLTQVLADIGTRMGASGSGDLQGKAVVINMSLVVGPPVADQGILEGQALPDLLDGLRNQMTTLAELGAIFVSSVGNDSDPRDEMMNPLEVRFGPRYPAAFAYEDPPLTQLIPVGALNQDGEPTVYSNYPGAYGISTYGGDLPRPDPWVPMAAEHMITHVDMEHLDALRGVYTASTYPALSRNDHFTVPITTPGGPDYPLYGAPQTNAWAYWSGTSFAAPIVTALVARALEGQPGQVSGQTVHDTLVSSSSQTLWTGLETGLDTPGPFVTATQQWQDL